MKKTKSPDSITPEHPRYVVFKKNWWTEAAKSWPEERQRTINSITDAVMNAPEGERLTKLYMQMIKHHQEIGKWGGKTFCEYLGLDFDFWADYEIAMMIGPGLFDAGLNNNLL